MNKIAKEVREFWAKESPYFQYDVEILDMVADSLPAVDKWVILQGYESASQMPEIKESYILACHKVFDRHNDIVCGHSHLTPNGVVLTKESSITELTLNLSTLQECKRKAVYRISDFNKDVMATMSLKSIATFTTALVKFNEENKLPMEITEHAGC